MRTIHVVTNDAKFSLRAALQPADLACVRRYEHAGVHGHPIVQWQCAARLYALRLYLGLQSSCRASVMSWYATLAGSSLLGNLRAARSVRPVVKDSMDTNNKSLCREEEEERRCELILVFWDRGTQVARGECGFSNACGIVRFNVDGRGLLGSMACLSLGGGLALGSHPYMLIRSAGLSHTMSGSWPTGGVLEVVADIRHRLNAEWFAQALLGDERALDACGSGL